MRYVRCFVLVSIIGSCSETPLSFSFSSCEMTIPSQLKKVSGDRFVFDNLHLYPASQGSLKYISIEVIDGDDGSTEFPNGLPDPFQLLEEQFGNGFVFRKYFSSTEFAGNEQRQWPVMALSDYQGNTILTTGFDYSSEMKKCLVG